MEAFLSFFYVLATGYEIYYGLQSSGVTAFASVKKSGSSSETPVNGATDTSGDFCCVAQLAEGDELIVRSVNANGSGFSKSVYTCSSGEIAAVEHNISTTVTLLS